MFNQKTLYLGTDLKKFNEIRNSLDAAGIKYSYKIKNHQNEMIYPGKGVIRDINGSLGLDLEHANQYEILVHKNDYEEAMYYMTRNK